MKFSRCLRCQHKLSSILISPRCCSECGSEKITTVSYTEWILIGGIIVAGAAYYFSR